MYTVFNVKHFNIFSIISGKINSEMCVCISVLGCVRVYVHACARVCMCMCVCVCVCACLCACTCVYLYMCGTFAVPVYVEMVASCHNGTKWIGLCWE